MFDKKFIVKWWKQWWTLPFNNATSDFASIFKKKQKTKKQNVQVQCMYKLAFFSAPFITHLLLFLPFKSWNTLQNSPISSIHQQFNCKRVVFLFEKWLWLSLLQLQFMALSLHLLMNKPKVTPFCLFPFLSFNFYPLYRNSIIWVQFIFCFPWIFPSQFLVIFIFAVSQLGSFQLLDQPKVLSKSLFYSRRRCAVKPLYAEPKRNESIVPSAATFVAPGMFLAWFWLDTK